MLQTHASVIFSVIVFILMRPITLIRYVCLSVLIDVFSMKTPSVLVWTQGLNAAKCTRFQTKTHWCPGGLSHVNWKSGSYQESMKITLCFPEMNACSNCLIWSLLWYRSPVRVADCLILLAPMKQTQRPKVLGQVRGLVWDTRGVMERDEAKINFKLGQSC